MENTTRNPILLFHSSGMFLFRIVHRALIDVLFQEPPRTTRAVLGPAPYQVTHTHRHGSPGIHTLDPPAQKTPYLIHHAGGVAILLDRYELQVLAQAQVEAQLGQIDVGLL